PLPRHRGGPLPHPAAPRGRRVLPRPRRRPRALARRHEPHPAAVGGHPVTASHYAAKPWLDLLTEAQRAPVAPAGSLVHALRAAVTTAPDRTFLAYFDGRLGYRETDELSDSVAGHLAERGLERGDRVAIMLQNSPLFVLALLGAWKAGAVVVPVNPMYKS